MLAALTLFVQTLVPTPPIEINHFFVTLDRPTFEAIKRSKWLKQFADVHVNTYASGKDSWTGCYVTGVGSYVELFGADKKFREGQSGIGLATQMAGGVDNVYSNFRNSAFGKRAVRENMDLGSSKNQSPLAHIATYVGDGRDQFNPWLMEFHEDLYRRYGVKVGAHYSVLNAAFRRKAYDGAMGDVIGLTVHPLPDDADAPLALQLLGFKQVGKTSVYRQGRCEFVVEPALTGYGISSARLSLRKSPAKVHVERFSKNCVLTAYPDGHAEWRFAK